MFIPLVAIVLFTVAMGVILWSLHETERQQQRDALYRDAAWAQQRVRLSLLSNQDQLASLARDIAAAQLDQEPIARPRRKSCERTRKSSL